MKPSPLRTASRALAAAANAGLLEPGLVGATTAAATFWGPTVATPYAAAAARYPQRAALIDDWGALTYRQLHKRSSRVAAALQNLGVNRTATVGLLCRNHRGFVEANIALAKLGACVVYLNTGLSASQCAAIIRREHITTVVADAEFADVLSGCSAEIVTVDPEHSVDWSFPELRSDSRLRRMPTPSLTSEPVILTSGTTGTPKGARRPVKAGDAAGALTLLEALPYRRGDTVVVAAPLFHAWGMSQHVLAASLAGTVVLRPHFDAAAALDDVVEHRAQTLVVVPAMLHRMLEVESPPDMASLQAVVSSGAALPGSLATEWMDLHGDTLYNFYGSTEVGQVTIAGPDDLREAPGTAGRPAPGVELLVLGADGEPLPRGEIGRIVVRGSAQFAGYTSGDNKPVDDDAMEIGDTGRIDAQGRLFVTGRIDDMIISGGENLYPTGIEAALLEHHAVAEVVVVGVPDAKLGQKVRAVLVLTPGANKPTKAALKSHARARLANYEVPREFVFVDALPRNATGKVLRRTLAEPQDV